MMKSEGGDPYNNIRGFLRDAVKRYGRVEMRSRAKKLIESLESNQITLEDRSWLDLYKKACSEVMGGEF